MTAVTSGARRPPDGWELTPECAEYPDSLRELHSPPEVVYGRGDPAALAGPCISIVGARSATPYGTQVAKMAARVAAECGVTVVSGGARGCDAAAGTAALEAGGRTVVVSGVGAEGVYPSTSRPVFEGAIAHGGAVIAVVPWGTPPVRWSFPQRNTVIAALSKVLVVTEAGVRSGTMSTAEAATELGREIYAIPGSIFSPNSGGTNALAAEGARLIPDERSLELAIALDYGVARFAENRDLAKLGPVMSALVAQPTRPDDLARQLGMGVVPTLKALTGFEAQGLACRLPDGRYAPTEAYYRMRK